MASTQPEDDSTKEPSKMKKVMKGAAVFAAEMAADILTLGIYTNAMDNKERIEKIRGSDMDEKKKASEIMESHVEFAGEATANIFTLGLYGEIVDGVEMVYGDSDDDEDEDKVNKLYGKLEAEVAMWQAKVKASEECVLKLTQEATEDLQTEHDALVQAYREAVEEAKAELEKANQAIAAYKAKQDVKIAKSVKEATLQLEELETRLLAQAHHLAEEETSKISTIKTEAKTKMEAIQTESPKALIGAEKKLDSIYQEAFQLMKDCSLATADGYAKVKANLALSKAEGKKKMEELKKDIAEELTGLQEEDEAEEQTMVRTLQQALKGAYTNMAQAEEAVASKLTLARK
jgi:hypothetical protein